MNRLAKFSIIVLTALASIACRQAAHRSFEPVPSGICLNSIQNCTFSASFTTEDFKWMGGNLMLTVFSPVRYSAADVALMAVGDTLIHNGDTLIISKLERSGNSVTINGGIEEGGCWLVADKEGGYTSRSWDDHPVYEKIGDTQVALDCDFIIIDCGPEPQDPVDTLRTGQKLYIENLEGSRCEFTCLNTTVTMKDDMLVEINRHWIP